VDMNEEGSMGLFYGIILIKDITEENSLKNYFLIKSIFCIKKPTQKGNYLV
jgi:hypothetical protein